MANLQASGSWLPPLLSRLGRLAASRCQSERPLTPSVVVWAALTMTTAIAVVCASAAIAADTYPAKPVRIIVAAGTGGGDDLAARLVASKLGELLGQRFIVENPPGAGGMYCPTLVAKSP